MAPELCYGRRRLSPRPSGAQPFAVVVAIATASALSAAPARAFERQWHLGVAAVGVAPTEPRPTGFGFGAYAAYGVSDMFDVRMELRSSFHAESKKSERFALHLGSAGLAYKLDVLEWIPSFGVRAGYYEQTAAEPGAARRGAALGGFAGLDHAFSRSFAAGVEVSVDRLLPEGGTSALALRAEYRFGY